MQPMTHRKLPLHGYQPLKKSKKSIINLKKNPAIIMGYLWAL